jgi:GxxExxY protein
MNPDEITYKINGCAMKVHSTLGNGFQEVIYQRCLAIELQKAGLNFDREVEQPIFYEGIGVGNRRADFVVECRIIVELKALVSLEDVHIAQVKNYVAAYNFLVGLLINFGSKSLQFKKVFNPAYDQSSKS